MQLGVNVCENSTSTKMQYCFVGVRNSLTFHKSLKNIFLQDRRSVNK